MKSLFRKVSAWKDVYRKVAIFSVLLCIVFIFLLHLVKGVSPKKLQVTFFDIGQGDAIFIKTPTGKQMLVDGGSSNLVVEKLAKEMSYFDRTLDVIVATHGDTDHVTGLIPTLQNYEVDTIVQSPIFSESGIFKELQKEIKKEVASGAILKTASAGDVINFGDGVTATILYPGKNISPQTETNDASVSLLITYGEHSFLLTGDLSSSYEYLLLSTSLPEGVTVYKAGHHGSNTSSGELLLSRITPEYSVISAGKDNRYGHPHVEAIGRLQQYSKEILSTIEKGSVTFVTDGALLEVVTSK